MSATEIILIVIGVAIFLLGYLMPARKKDLDEEVQLISEDEVRKLVAGEVEHVKDQIADIVDETVNYSIEKAERAMERMTNEKIMAVNEYSDTVLEEINKNHKEVVFLYDMLNDKHDNLMSTINEATVAADDIKQTVKDAELTAAEAADRVDAVIQAADETTETIKDAEEAAVQAQQMAEKVVRSIINVIESRKKELSEILHAPAGKVKPAEEETREIPQDVREDTATVSQREAVPIRVEETGIIGEGAVRDFRSFGNTEELQDLEGMEEPGEIEEIEEIEDTADFDSDVQDDFEMSEEETVDFTPISPRRVEIIHQPDGDYVADNGVDMSTSAAFASMGFFAPRAEAAEESKKRTRTRKSPRRERFQESTPAVDIQFAQGKDNGRNSNERILELHKAGKSNMAIAKELGLGLGEVKLVIDLFEGM